MSEPTFHSSSFAGTTEADAVAAIAQEAVEPHALDPQVIYGVTTPAGADHEVIDLEHFLPSPRRKNGSITLNDSESFARYVNKHLDDAATELYADVTKQTIVALLNDHSQDDAGWADHRATLYLRRTPQWEIWTRNDGTLLEQVAFAELVEDNLPDIVEPDGATLLEMAQSFQAHTKVQFESARHLQGGERQLIYTEETTASAGTKGDITIPPTFVLGIAPFEVGELYKVTARLRYRITDGRLRLGFRLDRPEDILRSAFSDVVKDVQTRTTIDVLYGTPRGT